MGSGTGTATVPDDRITVTSPRDGNADGSDLDRPLSAWTVASPSWNTISSVHRRRGRAASGISRNPPSGTEGSTFSPLIIHTRSARTSAAHCRIRLAAHGWRRRLRRRADATVAEESARSCRATADRAWLRERLETGTFWTPPVRLSRTFGTNPAAADAHGCAHHRPRNDVTRCRSVQGGGRRGGAGNRGHCARA